MDLSFIVYSKNIMSILSIYEDSEKIRVENQEELLAKLEKEKTWTDTDFEKYSHYNNHFKWLLMQSLYISGFIYFENFMRSTAKVIEKNTSSKVKLKDLKGNGILDAYRKYINLIGDIEIANSNNELWKEILDFKTIRNSLTHHYGEIDKTNNLIEKHELYFGPSKKMIRIRNLDFLKDFCDKSVSYMELISNGIKEKTNSD